jgi:hypothetical protein
VTQSSKEIDLMNQLTLKYRSVWGLVVQVEWFVIFSFVVVGENDSEHNKFCGLWCPYSLMRFIIPGVIIGFLRHINTIVSWTAAFRSECLCKQREAGIRTS